MRNLRYIIIFSFIALAAYSNAIMDYIDFILHDANGFEWHFVKAVLMQGSYVIAIGIALNLNTLRSWGKFLIVCGLITWAFHDVPYHFIFN